MGESGIHAAIWTRNIGRVQSIIEKNPQSVHDMYDGISTWSPLDRAIAFGNLDIARLIRRNGGRPTPSKPVSYISPVRFCARWGSTSTLKWVFENNIYPSTILITKDSKGCTPLDHARIKKQWETLAFLQKLLYVDPVFLAIQRAKRDYHQCCALRRLPDELLDMVVDEVARHFDLKVVW